MSDADTIERIVRELRAIHRRQPGVREQIGESIGRLGSCARQLRSDRPRNPWHPLDDALIGWEDETGLRGAEARARLDAVCAEQARKGPRAKDRMGRELYRASRRDWGVRLVVDPDAGEREGDLPALLWVGQSRPPAWCWSGDEGRRER